MLKRFTNTLLGFLLIGLFLSTLLLSLEYNKKTYNLILLPQIHYIPTQEELARAEKAKNEWETKNGTNTSFSEGWSICKNEDWIKVGKEFDAIPSEEIIEKSQVSYRKIDPKETWGDKFYIPSDKKYIYVNGIWYRPVFERVFGREDISIIILGIGCFLGLLVLFRGIFPSPPNKSPSQSN